MRSAAPEGKSGSAGPPSRRSSSPANPDHALAEPKAALPHDSYNEYLYQRIMQLRAAAGRLDAIRRTLTLLEPRLAELGVVPSAQTRQVAATLLGSLGLNLEAEHGTCGEPGGPAQALQAT